MDNKLLNDEELSCINGGEAWNFIASYDAAPEAKRPKSYNILPGDKCLYV